MIGPMIGTSSSTPAMTDSRTAYRPKIGSTVRLRTISPTNVEEPDREAEDELAADPLPEVALDGLDDRPGVEPPAFGQRPVEGRDERRLVLEDVGDPDRQDEVGEQRTEEAAGPSDEGEQE